MYHRRYPIAFGREYDYENLKNRFFENYQDVIDVVSKADESSYCVPDGTDCVLVNCKLPIELDTLTLSSSAWKSQS